MLPLPAGGRVRAWQGRECPVCRFELMLFDATPLATFPLCAGCYAERAPPPDAAAAEERAAPPCLDCPHPDEHPLVARLAVCEDRHSADGGMLILDPGGNPHAGWRLISTRGSIVIELPTSVRAARLPPGAEAEAETGCRMLELEFKPGQEPVVDGRSVRTHRGSVLTDPLMLQLVRVRFDEDREGGGRASGARGSRGRGRGRARTCAGRGGNRGTARGAPDREEEARRPQGRGRGGSGAHRGRGRAGGASAISEQ